MAKFSEKFRIKASISTSQALWGLLILGVLWLNFALLNKNSVIPGFIANAAYQKNLGGPSIELNDSLLASADINDSNEFIDNRENLTDSDALTQILASNALSVKSTVQKTDKSDKLFPPTIGWNWGQLHAFNAVDIANSCGTPVYAAFEGFVMEESIDNNWSGGYGNYIRIEHPNNIQTLYAHLEKATVSTGQYVKSKELIGYMGNTGNTHGPTGCHLHYEVHGAKNPLAK
ncbi:M23 family metallopeptidase [Candidatus Wolfebacteria bacterium]|nr:M23 family metallopeptidase [Candidatus Wolfebacteria bacterium]